jgi:hypothetical protein
MNENDPSLANLMLALSDFQFEPIVEFQYRVYYDIVSRDCTYKTIDNDPGTNYVVVTKDEYEKIDFCPLHYVTVDGKIERKEVDHSKQLRFRRFEMGYKTIKGNNIFLVNDAYGGKTDNWSYRQ